MTSQRGLGTTWTITIPIREITFAAHAFRTPGLPFPVAIDTSWELVPDRVDATPIDAAAHLGLPTTARGERRACFARGDDCVSIAVDEAPRPSAVRRLVATPPAAYAEVITQEAIEGLALRPDRLAAAGARRTLPGVCETEPVPGSR
jgi:hypothetical protein